MVEPSSIGLCIDTRHYDLSQEKIIFSFLVYKLHNANWNAKQSDFFKLSKKIFEKNPDLYCKIDVTPFDIEWNYSIKKAILCYNFLAGDVWRCS